MRKKILIGSMLVLALLLLMPSIPAIQQKTIKEGFKQDLQEKLESITLDDIKDIEVLDGIKHPILYSIVLLFIYCNILRCNFYFELCLRTYESGYEWGIDIIYPILFFIFGIKWILIEYRTMEWIYFWNYISETFGWNWDI